VREQVARAPAEDRGATQLHSELVPLEIPLHEEHRVTDPEALSLAEAHGAMNPNAVQERAIAAAEVLHRPQCAVEAEPAVAPRNPGIIEDMSRTLAAEHQVAVPADGGARRARRAPDLQESGEPAAGARQGAFRLERL